MERVIFDRCFQEAKTKYEILQDPWELFEFLNELAIQGVASILEIGCHMGGSAMMFLEYGAVVTSIDIVENPQAKALESLYPERFRLIQADSQAGNFNTPDRYDCLFIDGGHTADESMSDFIICKDFVHPGGMVVFHDIVESEEFKRANIHVYKTWQALRSHYRHKEIVADCNKDRGIGILYV